MCFPWGWGLRTEMYISMLLVIFIDMRNIICAVAIFSGIKSLRQFSVVSHNIFKTFLITCLLVIEIGGIFLFCPNANNFNFFFFCLQVFFFLGY